MPSQSASHGSRRPRRRLGRRVRPNEGAARGGRGGNSGKGGTASRTSSRNGAQSGSSGRHSERDHHPDNTYKTELCNNWIEFGQCRYNNKCRFAHGEEELRVARRINSDKNWKSELCRNYHMDGACSYGRRCHFIHEETPDELARMRATQKRVCGQKSQRKAAPRVENTAPPVKQRTRAVAAVDATAVAQKELQQETKVPVSSPYSNSSSATSPSAATLALASSVASIHLEELPIHPLAYEEVGETAPFSSFQITAPFVSSPMPISRKRSLQRFCHLVGLPVEETNPNEAAAAEAVSSGSPPSGESPPFLLRPQSAFGHMHGKVIYHPKTPFAPAVAPRTPPRMKHDSPAMRARLPVFTRIASDTGVTLTHPPSPVTTSP